jgi:hypothetical protein
MPVIQASWEEYIGGSQSKDGPGKKNKTFSEKIAKAKRLRRGQENTAHI